MRWIIGDIHGMLTPLTVLLETVRAADVDARFIFVGDYVNRGPDSRGVIELLLHLPGARFVRGNHDDVFDLVLHGSCFAPELLGPDVFSTFQWFSHHGLVETLLSYGADRAMLESVAQHATAETIRQACANVPAEHRAFIRDLPPVVEDADLFVAHALWPPNEPTDDPPISQRLLPSVRLRDNIVWGRFNSEDLAAPKAWKRPGYFGHTPVDAYHNYWRPVVGNQMVLLDTAAALSANGRLTAWCHETGHYIQADRNGRTKTGPVTPP